LHHGASAIHPTPKGVGFPHEFVNSMLLFCKQVPDS